MRCTPLARPPSGSMRPRQFPLHWGKSLALSHELPCCAPQWLMNGSVMGSVEFDSLSQTGCASLRSPMSPTIPEPCSRVGSLNGGANPRKLAPMLFRSLWRCHSPCSAILLAALTYPLVSSRTSGPRAGLGCSKVNLFRELSALAKVIQQFHSPRRPLNLRHDAIS